MSEVVVVPIDWIVKRGEWLDKEARNGGDFEHLDDRSKELAYILEMFSDETMKERKDV